MTEAEIFGFIQESIIVLLKVVGSLFDSGTGGGGYYFYSPNHYFYPRTDLDFCAQVFGFFCDGYLYVAH